MTNIQKYLVILIGGVLASFVVASLAEGLVARGSSRLAPAVRERVYQRIVSLDLYCRLLDGLAIALLILGLLKVWGVVKWGYPTEWGLPAAVTGIGLMSLERVSRSWIKYRAYAKEEEAWDVRGRAMGAAWMVTLAELALVAGLGWFFAPKFKNLWEDLAGGRPPGHPSSAEEEASPYGAGETVLKHSYVNEKEALKILGQDKAYLDLLVPHERIHTRSSGGLTFYRLDDLTTCKEAGLPALEELQGGAEPAPKESPAQPEGDESKKSGESNENKESDP